MKIRDFLLERYFAAHEFSAPIVMCASDCESFGLDEILALADPETRSLWDHLHLGYTETLGHPLLRAEIARLYGRDLTPENVVVFAGAQEAILAFMNVVLNAGDQVVVTVPTYQSLYSIAEAIGSTVTPWTLDPDRGWSLDPAQLESLITPATRAVVVNFPNNPTGYLPAADEFCAIVDTCARHNLYLFSDEVYRLLEFDPRDRLPAAAALDDRAVSLGVMSKAFGLAGLRIGWVVSQDRALLDRIARFKDYTTICSSAPSEILALIALRATDRIVARNLDLIRNNLALLDRFFADQDLMTWARPKAGSIAFPRLADPLGPGEAFCEDLLDKAGVLLLPGSNFEFPGAFVRLGFGRANLPEGLARLRAYLQDKS